MYVMNSKGGKILLGIKAGGRMKGRLWKFFVIIFALMFSANVLLQMENINVEASDTGLVAYWSFDEGSGSVAYDGSNNNNDGTVTGPSWTTGISGSALRFNDDYVNYVLVPDSNSLDPSEDFTFMFWVYPTYDDFDHRHRLLNKHQGGVNNDYSWYTYLGDQEGKASLENTPQRFEHIISESSADRNTWSHFAITFDDSSNTASIYFNGVLDVQSNIDFDIRNNDQDLYIGYQPGTGTNNNLYDGILDEVYIYSRALSSVEIQQYYELLVSGESESDDTGLVAYWSFDEGSGSVAYDGSGKHNDGTIYGASWTTGMNKTALSFDGVDDYIEVPVGDLNLPSSFTIEMWIRPSEEYSIYSSYNQGLMSKGCYQLFFDKSEGKLEFELVPKESDSWSESYDSSEQRIHCLGTYNNKLYAGTAYFESYSRIYEYDGTSWSLSFDCPDQEINHLLAYKGKLYAAAGRGDYRNIYSYDSVEWKLAFSEPGGGNPSSRFMSLVVYKDKLYIGSGYDGKIFVYDGATWELSSTIPESKVGITSFAVYKDQLYASANEKIYVFDDSENWIISHETNEVALWGLTVYDGCLYVGSQNNGVIYCYDGTKWIQKYDSNEMLILCQNVYNGNLWSGTGRNGRVLNYDDITWSINYEDQNEAEIWGIGKYNGKLYVGSQGTGKIFEYGNNKVIRSQDSLWDDDWVHIAVTYDGSILKLFKDGVLQSQVTITIDPRTNNLPLIIGKSYGSQMMGGSSESFYGEIDEIVVHNIALQPNEFWGLNFEQPSEEEDDLGKSENETPGFTTTVAIAAVGIGALVAFFRRRRN